MLSHEMRQTYVWLFHSPNPIFYMQEQFKNVDKRFDSVDNRFDLLTIVIDEQYIKSLADKSGVNSDAIRA